MPDRLPPDWGSVRMVADREGLEQALEEWHDAKVLGIDTESNSFYAYTDRLCLLQVSTDEHDYIVDPQPLGDDLRAMNALLADPGVVKIFHAAEFDLMLLRKDLDAKVRGLFDTQVAMTLLSHARTGLAALIESYYGMKLSKKEQRSDWGKRPLTDAQIAYARIDTHFLPDLYRRLCQELEEKNMTGAAHGEFERLEREVLPPREPDMEGWQRLKGARTLDGRATARLRALFQWRERLAQQIDKPVFRVLANETLLDLARHPPATQAQLAGRTGVGWSKARRVGDDVFAALSSAEGEVVERGRKRDTPQQRKRKRVIRENQDALRQWRKRLAIELGLPSERLIHRRHLEEIARRLPRTAEELTRTVDLNDWQREHLEASLLKCLAELPDPPP